MRIRVEIHIKKNEENPNKMKKLMLVALLTAFAVFAASNVFHVTFESDAWIGANLVKAGEYKITIEGDKAILKSGKTVIEVPAKLEPADHKYAENAIIVQTIGNKAQVQQIELGGKAERIVFTVTPIPTGGE